MLDPISAQFMRLHTEAIVPTQICHSERSPRSEGWVCIASFAMNPSSIYLPPGAFYILSGVSIPSNCKLCTNRRSTNPVTLNKNARFSSSGSDKMWCL